MTNDDIARLERVRAVCCREWGIPPWDFDAAWEAGYLTITNVERTLDVAIVCSPEPEILEEYLYPGSMEARKEAAEEQRAAQDWAAFVAMKGKT